MHQSIINPSVRLYVGPRAVVRTHKVGKLRIALCTRTLVLRWRHSSQHEKIVQSACTILHNIILILNNMNKSWCTLWYLVVWFAEEFSVSGQDVQQHRRPLQDLRSPSRPLQWCNEHSMHSVKRCRIGSGSSAEEVRAAYLKAAVQTHPDSTGSREAQKIWEASLFITVIYLSHVFTINAA